MFDLASLVTRVLNAQVLTPAVSDMVALAHQVHHSQCNDVHISTGHFTDHIRLFPGPGQSAILTAPIFDKTALHSLPSLVLYSGWLRTLSKMLEKGQLQEEMEKQQVTVKLLRVCLLRIPCPVFCAWGQSWKAMKPLGQPQARKEHEIDELFAEIHDTLLECEPLIEYVMGSGPMLRRWLCSHCRGAAALDAAASGSASGPH